PPRGAAGPRGPSLCPPSDPNIHIPDVSQGLQALDLGLGVAEELAVYVVVGLTQGAGRVADGERRVGVAEDEARVFVRAGFALRDRHEELARAELRIRVGADVVGDHAGGDAGFLEACGRLARRQADAPAGDRGVDLGVA